jgi:hypothetical protein
MPERSLSGIELWTRYTIDKRDWSLFLGQDSGESDDLFDMKMINGCQSRRFGKHYRDLSKFPRPTLLYHKAWQKEKETSEDTTMSGSAML